jgi:hemoglobin
LPHLVLRGEVRQSVTDPGTVNEVAQLVDSFYRRVRRDPLLGPFFERHVEDWEKHLPVIVDFWTTALYRTGRYRGMPLQVHLALPDLSQPMFDRWLTVFSEAAKAHPNRQMSGRAVQIARKVARSFWREYQRHHLPDQLPTDLTVGQ